MGPCFMFVCILTCYRRAAKVMLHFSKPLGTVPESGYRSLLSEIMASTHAHKYIPSVNCDAYIQSLVATYLT